MIIALPTEDLHSETDDRKGGLVCVGKRKALRRDSDTVPEMVDEIYGIKGHMQ